MRFSACRKQVSFFRSRAHHWCSQPQLHTTLCCTCLERRGKRSISRQRPTRRVVVLQSTFVLCRLGLQNRRSRGRFAASGGSERTRVQVAICVLRAPASGRFLRRTGARSSRTAKILFTSNRNVLSAWTK